MTGTVLIQNVFRSRFIRKMMQRVKSGLNSAYRLSGSFRLKITSGKSVKVHLVRIRKSSSIVVQLSETIRTIQSSTRVAKTNAISRSGISSSVSTTTTDTATTRNFRVKTSILGWDSNGWRVSCRTCRRTSIRICSCRSFIRQKKSAARSTVMIRNLM